MVCFLYQLPSTHVVSLLERRDYVINELVETERNYVDVLNGLQKHFMKPMAGFLSDEDYHTIFFGIKVRFVTQYLTFFTLAYIYVVYSKSIVILQKIYFDILCFL